MQTIVGLALAFACAAIAKGQMQHMMPPQHPLPPPPLQAPPPYNMYGPINPYAASSSMMYPPPPQQMMSPPMPYPTSTSATYAYPMMAAAAPYPSYGVPPPMMYPPPYQTYSGAGPNGDPFTSSTSGICKFSANQYESPMGLLLNGYLKKANLGMICSQYN